MCIAKIAIMRVHKISYVHREHDLTHSVAHDDRELIFGRTLNMMTDHTFTHYLSTTKSLRLSDVHREHDLTQSVANDDRELTLDELWER